MYREKERLTLTARDRLEEEIMLALRTTRGLDPATLPENLREDTAAVLEKYAPYGLVRREGPRFVLTPRGMFVSNAIISELFGLIPD